jgi:hypothetical protein
MQSRFAVFLLLLSSIAFSNAKTLNLNTVVSSINTARNNVPGGSLSPLSYDTTLAAAVSKWASSCSLTSDPVDRFFYSEVYVLLDPNTTLSEDQVKTFVAP